MHILYNPLHVELPEQVLFMSNQYNSTTDVWHQIYTVSQFLGHLAVWEDLFPTYFSANFIVDLPFGIKFCPKMEHTMFSS